MTQRVKKTKKKKLKINKINTNSYKKKKVIKKTSKSKIKKKAIKKQKKNTLDSKKILIIYEKIEIRGTINSKYTIDIFGKVEGEIIANKVNLHKTGIVLGKISAEDINVYGKCYANLFVKNSCEIFDTATIKGDINYDNNIIIQKGSNILGELIPKKKPLALPNYTKDNKAISNQEIKSNIQTANSDYERKKNDKSLDKIISKIFK